MSYQRKTTNPHKPYPKHKTFRSYKREECTRCGKLEILSHRIRERYGYIWVTIALCRGCSGIVIKEFIDRLYEGQIREMAIDQLTKFGQK